MFLTHLLQINIGYKHNNYFLSFIDYSILNVFFFKYYTSYCLILIIAGTYNRNWA